MCYIPTPEETINYTKYISTIVSVVALGISLIVARSSIIEKRNSQYAEVFAWAEYGSEEGNLLRRVSKLLTLQNIQYMNGLLLHHGKKKEHLLCHMQ